jgi:hypothetical protein
VGILLPRCGRFGNCDLLFEALPEFKALPADTDKWEKEKSYSSDLQEKV